MANNTNGGGGDIRQRRRALGVSQLELAQLAECSPAMVGLLDRGYRPHRSAVLDRVNAVLNHSTSNDAVGCGAAAKTDVVSSDDPG